MTKGTLALLRLNQVGSKVTIVGPPIVVDEIWKPEALYQLEELKKQHSSSIRKYLKEYGIDYLTYEMREG
ncbi:MAG: hypothetical protein LRY73_09080 [Bacillus sp. (in: Bacteria)]|nr:hypothetical protein [Bacillus sp. (in: firmicutes)]